MRIKSICIVRLSALGDVLMLVPLVRTIQKALPDTSITWIISRPAYDLVEGIEGLEFIVIEKPNSLTDYWRFYQSIKNRRFDILLAPQASLRANLLYPFIRAKRKIGYDFARAKDGHRWFVHESIEPGHDHTLDGFLKFAKPLGIRETSIEWNLAISEEDRQWANQQIREKKPIIVINPAASKPERSWSSERYIQVIHHAQQKWNAQIVLTGGPGRYDRNLADSILKQVNCIDLVGKTKPKQLLALLSLADVVICPDTGPSHMATAVNTPVIALHAVTNPDVSGPYLFRHLVVNYYPQAVQDILQQSMEKTPWGTHVHGKETMDLIPVEAVITRLDEFLSTNFS